MRFALLIIGLQLGTSVLCAQVPNISVAVSFTDSAAGSVFQSGFAAAFRTLGDIEVVGITEAPDYVLTGVAMCNPKSCNDPVSYALGIRLYEPSTLGMAQFIAFEAVPPEHLAKNQDSIVGKIFETIRHYSETHAEWVMTWGRQRYEQAIRELVRQIDAECFDRIRALKRVPRNATHVDLEKYRAYVNSRSWLC